MRAKTDKDLWLIAILTILLILVITAFPATIARVILGLPFLLFFPGYALIAALFTRNDSLGGVERVALSFGLSLAVVPLIGFVLNFTPWGIRLYPVLISLAAFILVASGIALYRRGRLAPEERFVVPFDIRLPDWWGQSTPDKILSVVLVVAIFGAIGTLGYAIANPRVGERFTEFYILGPEGKAGNYTTELSVGEEGIVIIGIVNHEHERADYRVEMWIDGERSKLRIDGQDREDIEVELEHGEKWEQEAGYVPFKAGERQKVEFVLYRDGEPYFDDPLHLWIDVDDG